MKTPYIENQAIYSPGAERTPFELILTCLTALIVALALQGRQYAVRQRLTAFEDAQKRTGKLLAFFHPYCDGGGGGERVLWVLISGLLNDEALIGKLQIIIYSRNGEAHKLRILEEVKQRFSIDLSMHMSKITFIKIISTFLLEPKLYPVATMMFQSLASVLIGIECIFRLTPDIYFDTMGAAFTYPFAKLVGGSKVVAYVHYPIISTDMLDKVRDQRPSYYNTDAIAKSVTISYFKLVYYRLFAHMYSFVGSYADKVMVNSSWTERHIADLWSLKCSLPSKGIRRHCNTSFTTQSSDSAIVTVPIQEEDSDGIIDKDIWQLEMPTFGNSINAGTKDNNQTLSQRSEDTSRLIIKLYPPCNTLELLHIPLRNPIKPRKRVILSIGQFRPEKDHLLQLR